MYKEHFGFTEEPFGITPDPRFFYENPSYREAYRHLLWGLTERRGLMTLIGAVGTGKTTILRHLVARSKPAVRCIVAEYPPSSFDELLTFTCRELGVQRSDRGGRLDQVTALKQALLDSHADNVTTALLLDEAQQLPEETLEGVRLLSNLESGGEKALQIVLAGQPELHGNLDRPSLAPLKQRIAFWGRLDRLKHGEIAAYIEYRLRVAGYRGPALFGPPVVEAIGFYSGGVPRLINVLCRDALVAAHRTGQRLVSPDIIVETARALHIGPAFDFTPSQPHVPDAPPPRPATPVPEPVRHDRPPVRSGGELHKAQRTTPPPLLRRPGRRKAKRGWFGVAIVVVLCVVAGLGGLALVRSLDLSVASLKDLSTTRPLTSKAAGGNTQVGAVPDRPSESLVPSSPPSAGAEGTPPAAAEDPAPPETGAAASDRPNTAEAPGAIADPPGDASAPASDRTTVAAQAPNRPFRPTPSAGRAESPRAVRENPNPRSAEILPGSPPRPPVTPPPEPPRAPVALPRPAPLTGVMSEARSGPARPTDSAGTPSEVEVLAIRYGVIERTPLEWTWSWRVTVHKSGKTARVNARIEFIEFQGSTRRIVGYEELCGLQLTGGRIVSIDGVHTLNATDSQRISAMTATISDTTRCRHAGSDSGATR